MTLYQPLTREDRVTVVLYRIGIVSSTLLIALAALLSLMFPGGLESMPPVPGMLLNVLLPALHVSVGLSVFFIHLYVGKFHRFLKRLYGVALVCLVVLFAVGNANPITPLFSVPPVAALLLMPLVLCLGFVAAKEAFCFRLIEGYLLALLMPFALFLYSLGLITGRRAAVTLAAVSALLVLFTLRKAFMPVHCDIGDKSAYQP